MSRVVSAPEPTSLELFLKGTEDRKQGREVYGLAGWTQDTRLRLRNMAKPIITSINGPAVGVGFTLALACDLRIASAEAVMSIPVIRFGIIPEFGSTYLLPRLLGIAKAYKLAESISQGTPLAMELTKKGLYQGLDNDLETQLQYERLVLSLGFQSKDHEEGVRAFLEKRQPEFEGK